MSLDPAVAAVRLAVRRVLTPDTDTDTVLVACSGGADSLALLAATVFELRREPARVVGAVVDHGLQDGSADHTMRVVAQMARLGVDETASIRVQVDGGGGPEAAAREARYAALGQLAQHFGAGTVLLGHTLDDQAETVLLGLARGSGGRSIAGMRATFRRDPPGAGPVYVRPLLDLRRAQTEAACRAEEIDFWTDPHNADPRFLRSRVRLSVLPVLERELGPGVAETLARTGTQLQHDMDALDDLAERHLAELYDETDGFDVRRIAALDHAVRSRMLRLAALGAGCPPSELTYAHVAALEHQVGNRTHLPKHVQLPGHVTAIREGDVLRLTRTL